MNIAKFSKPIKRKKKGAEMGPIDSLSGAKWTRREKYIRRKKEKGPFYPFTLYTFYMDIFIFVTCDMKSGFIRFL